MMCRIKKLCEKLYYQSLQIRFSSNPAYFNEDKKNVTHLCFIMPKNPLWFPAN